MTDQTLRFVIENDVRGTDELAELRAQFTGAREDVDSLKERLTELDTAQERVSDGVDRASESQRTKTEADERAKTSMADLKAGYDIFLEVLDRGKQVFDATVGVTVEYAGQVRGLAQAWGVSTEEASRAIQVADDLGVSYDALKAAGRKLLDEGIQPTVENLAALSDQYKAIEDPVARAEFAAEKFGARWQNVVGLLDAGGDSLRAMQDDLEGSALVMGEESVRAAREYEIALDGVNDTLEELKIAAGNEALPAVNFLLQGIQNGIDLGKQAQTIYQALAINFMENAGAIDANQAALRRDALAAGDLMAAWKEIDPIIAAAQTATEAYNPVLDETERLLRRTREATDENTGAMGGGNEVYALAEDALRDYNIGMSTRLELEREIKIITGEITAADVERETAVGALTKQLELGNISQAEYVALLGRIQTEGLTASQVLKEVAQSIRDIPDRTVRINYVSSGNPNPAAGDIGLPGGDSAPVVITNPDSGNVDYGGLQALGGDYVVNRPTVFVAGESGPERIRFTPVGAGGVEVGNPLTINVDARGSVLSEAQIEAAVRRALDKAGATSRTRVETR